MARVTCAFCCPLPLCGIGVAATYRRRRTDPRRPWLADLSCPTGPTGARTASWKSSTCDHALSRHVGASRAVWIPSETGRRNRDRHQRRHQPIGAQRFELAALRDAEQSLNVDEARSVMVRKGPMSSGYAGIESPLFFGGRTSMLFGDATKSVGHVIEELKAL